MKQITVLLCFVGNGALLLSQQTARSRSSDTRAAVSVNVSLGSNKKEASVYVSGIALVGDDLQLRLTNDGDVPIIAVALEYEVSGCNQDEEYWAIGADADTAREPGMSSVDIPAHGQAGYSDSHMASALAFSALKQTTRYVQASARVLAFKLRDGEVISLAENDLRDERARPPIPADLCGHWKWDEQLSQIRGYRGSSRGESVSAAGERVSYTCGVLNGVLTCPE